MQEVVMRKRLPVRPSLEHLNAQAKDLLAAYRQADPEALSRFRDALPAAKGLADADLAKAKLALHDAQSVIAREYGFASFAELRAHIETIPSPEAIRALTAMHPNAPLPDKIQEALLATTAAARAEDVSIPALLPLLPLRNALLTVRAISPLAVGRAPSLAALRVAREDSGLLAVFTQKDAAQTSPSETDLHPVGCVVRIQATVPYDEGEWIVVQGLAWIRLESIEPAADCPMARIVPFVVREGSLEEVRTRETALRERLRAIVASLPDGQRLLALTERMTALELADATIANLPCSIDDKARYAAEPSLTARLDVVLDLLGV
jgi:Lon protease-like protein